MKRTSGMYKVVVNTVSIGGDVQVNGRGDDRVLNLGVLVMK